MRRHRHVAIFARFMIRGAWIVRAQVESIFRVQSKCWFRARGVEQRRPASCSIRICFGPRRLPTPSEFVIPFVVWIIVAIEFDAFAANDVGKVGRHRSLKLPLSIDLLSFSPSLSKFMNSLHWTSGPLQLARHLSC